MARPPAQASAPGEERSRRRHRVACVAGIGALLVAGCYRGRIVETSVFFTVHDVEGRTLTAQLRFLDRDGRIFAAGTWSPSGGFEATTPPASPGWGATVRSARVEAAGRVTADVPLTVELHRSRLPVGGHPSYAWKRYQRYEVRGEALLRPVIDAEEAAYRAFALEAPQRQERRLAAVLLGLYDRDPLPWGGALVVLDRREPAPADFDSWLEELRGPTAAGRRAAALVLSEYAAERRREALRTALRRLRRHGPSAYGAVVALEELPREEGEEGERAAALIALLEDQDAALRRRVARALGRIPGTLPEAGLAALRRVLADPDAGVRRAAALTLAARRREAWAETELIAALDDPSPFVRTQAAMELVRDLDRSEPRARLESILLETLADERRVDTDRTGAAWAIGRLGRPSADALPVLLTAAASPAPLVRAAVARPLGLLRSEPAAVAALEALQRDEHPSVRQAAGRALSDG